MSASTAVPTATWAIDPVQSSIGFGVKHLGVSTYREEAIKSNIVRASHYTAEKVVNANAGQLITTQYA